MNHGENFHRRHLLSTTIANISARTLVRTALLSVQRLPRRRRSRYPRGDDTPLGTHGPPQRHPAGGARGRLSRGGGARVHRLLVGGVRRRSVDRAGLGAAWTSRATLGTAIVGAFTRGPAIIAIGAAASSMAAPGRFVLGIGS